MMMEQRVQLVFVASVVALIVAIVMAAYGFPKIVKRQVQKNVQLDNSSATFEKWQKLPFPIQFKVYLFNVTNPEEVTQGARPKLAQVGPYCYDQYREKSILSYSENDTITYMLKKRFVFNKQQSAPLTQDDPVTVINLSYVALLLKVEEMMPGMISMVNEAMEFFYPNLEDPFLRARVGDLLFDGIFLNCSADNTPLKLVCARLRQQAPATMRPAHDDEGFYFSMFSHSPAPWTEPETSASRSVPQIFYKSCFFNLNLTESGPYEMNRGTEDISKLGQIVSYKDETSMSVWRDPYCSMINGSDSSIFPPIDTSNVPSRLYTFEPQICRSMYASLVGPTSVFNMSAYHYEVDRLSLACKSAEPSNKCFCQKNWSAKHDGCLLMGVLDLSPCQKVPVVASLPHFYLASEELLEYIAEGLTPEKEKHNTYVYIEPTTGVVLKGVRRLQFNIELRKLPAATQLANVTTGLFPMLWIEEGAQVPDDVVQLLRKTNVTLGYVEGLRWTLLAVALMCCAWAGAVFARKRHLWPKRNHSVSFVMGAKKSAIDDKAT